MMSELDAVLRAVYRKDYLALEPVVSMYVNDRDADGRTPLIHAILASDADPQMVRFLIDHGADTNVHDKGEAWTPLHFAARDQNEAIIRVLLEAGAEVDALDAFNNTPLVRAVFNNSPNLSLVGLLLEYGADPHKKNNADASPVDIARKMGNYKLVDFLNSHPDPKS
jgi:uncharacterized protein